MTREQHEKIAKQIRQFCIDNNVAIMTATQPKRDANAFFYYREGRMLQGYPVIIMDHMSLLTKSK